MIYGLMKKMKEEMHNKDNVKILVYDNGDMGDFIGSLCLHSYVSDNVEVDYGYYYYDLRLKVRC